MSSQQSYWKGGGKDALLGKAVVSPTGHVVAKNYDPKQLHEGDLGLSVRVDRKFEEMTPEQRMAAAGVVDELAALLKQGVGAETDLGFTPGMVVRATSEDSEVHGLIERITPFSVLLRVVSALGTLILKQLPLGVWALEELDGFFGREGLVLDFAIGGDNVPAEREDEQLRRQERFNFEVLKEIRSDAAIRQCIEANNDASLWLAKRLPTEELRRWTLDHHSNLAPLVLPIVERIETVIEWFTTRSWKEDGDRRHPHLEVAGKHTTLADLAVDRLVQLKATDEQLLALLPDVEDLPRAQVAQLVLGHLQTQESLVALLKLGLFYGDFVEKALGYLKGLDASDEFLLSLASDKILDVEWHPTIIGFLQKEESAMALYETLNGYHTDTAAFVILRRFGYTQERSRRFIENGRETRYDEDLVASAAYTVEELTAAVVDRAKWRCSALTMLFGLTRSETVWTTVFDAIAADCDVRPQADPKFWHEALVARGSEDLAFAYVLDRITDDVQGLRALQRKHPHLEGVLGAKIKEIIKKRREAKKAAAATSG